ncbi:hypothetical protein CFP56_041328 [Quercus suber]|uniref:LRAT domain-containing protein n=1 Tax=Quercus suber TaxID=58331 RepID=A0AAW0IW15_QUESU
MGVLTNKIEREDLKPGDHIYSYRLAYTYSHHGQETGTGTVLDRFIGSSLPQQRPLDDPCSICDDQSRVMGSSLLVEISTSMSMMSHENSFLPNLVEVPALLLHPSHPNKNNCEDFALCCKTGLRVIPTVGQSGQASSFQAAASAGGVILSATVSMARSSILGVAGLAASCGTYCVKRYINDIGVRRDVMNVVLEEET